MRNLRLVIEYDGTAFGGWQRQPNARTVQAAIEDALAGMTGGPVTLRGAGRTDAGVHARAQVACFETEAPIPVEGFRKGLNAALPSDVAVVTVEEVAPEFDARRSARGKHYCYRLWTRPSRSPIECRWAWHVWQPLDLDAMQRAATALLGQHDFSAFALRMRAEETGAVLRRADVSREGTWSGSTSSHRFLRTWCGSWPGRWSRWARTARRGVDGGPAAARDRTQTGRTAPHGLTLERVWYEDHPAEMPRPCKLWLRTRFRTGARAEDIEAARRRKKPP